MQSLETQLNELKKKYKKKYGFCLMEYKIEKKAGKEFFKATVLLESQKNDILETLGKSLDAKITVISKAAKPPLGYGKSKNAITDILSRPIENIGKNINKHRSTQVKKSDFAFDILLEKDDWLLIRLADKTIGWIKKEFVKTTGKKTTHKFDKKINKASLLKVAKKYIGATYLLGGTTEDGIDCSGLTQRLLLESSNIMLPKNSKDQAKLGVKIPLSNAKTGDLILLEEKSKKTSHIAMFIDDKNSVIHSCLKNKKVMVENLQEVLKFYNLVSINRL